MSAGEFRAVLEGVRSGGDLKSALRELSQSPVADRDSARYVVALLDEQHDALFASVAEPGGPFALATGLFQQVESREAFEVLAHDGLPRLRALFDESLASDEPSGQLVFVAKIFGLYHQAEDTPRVAAAARHPLLADQPLWPVVFDAYAEEGHPEQPRLLELLSHPLPRGFVRVPLLGYANRLAREAGADHPFDCAGGYEFLEHALLNNEPEGIAVSAAAALPFLAEPARANLLALGLDHESPSVQLESAWASAKLGSRAGVAALGRACLDPRHSGVAVSYLEELGELNAVPARAKNPHFVALAEMALWLSHPMEFGRPPDEIDVLDHRTLIWPLDDEPRPLWLVRYRYRGAPGESDTVGVGMVGSINFSLLGETSPDLAAEDIYALHCCWELEVEQHPEAPSERSALAGREILKRHGNRGF